MSIHNPARARGLVGRARAEGNAAPLGTPEEIHAELMRTVAAFREKHEEELKGISARFDDVVTRDHVENINASITELQNALDAANQQISQLEIGGGAADPSASPLAREHNDAFRAYFTRGDHGNLSDLEVRAELTTQSDPDGGYMVPHEVESGIDQVLRNLSVFRQLASVSTIGTQTWSKFINMGGATSEWVGEETPRNETDTPSLREIRLSVNELSAMPVTTQYMLDDASFDVAGWLADEVAETFAQAEAQAFINGDGANKPKGILSYNWVDNASWQWGSFGRTTSGAVGGFTAPTAATSPADDFIDLHGALRQQARVNASWLMNDKTMHTVRKFKDNDGAYIWAPPASAAAVPTILAKPAYTDDYMPDVASGNIPILFGDFSKTYRILNRIGIRVLRDPFTTKGKVKFYTTKRIGGGAQHFEYMKGMLIAS